MGFSFSVGSALKTASLTDSNPSYSQAGPELSAVPLALAGLRVLVVADEVTLRATIKALLEQCGAKVMAMAATDEVFDELKQVKPDILVVDLGMSDPSEYALIHRVRSLEPEQGGQVPAVALTMHAMPRNRRRAFSVGYQMYMPRTVRGTELVTMLAILAGRVGKVHKLYPKMV